MAPSKALSREKIFEIAKSLPPAPKVLADLGILLRDNNSDLHAVGELIKRDTALAAHIIRIANSIVYGPKGNSPVGTVEEAVARVGYKEIYRLVGMVATGRLTERPLKYYGISTGLLRANMLYTALVCEALAEAARLDSRTAYTAGLIRTLGILVLDRVAELLPSVEPYKHESQRSYARWEGLNFVFTHCEVAGMILDEWGFPPDTTEAVRKHYLLRDDDYAEKLACLLNLAGGIVAVAGVSLPGEFDRWESSSRQAEVIGLTPAMINHASERARSAYSSFLCHIEPEENGAVEIQALREPPKPTFKTPPVEIKKESTTKPPIQPANVAVTPNKTRTKRPGPWWENAFFDWPVPICCSFVVAAMLSITFVAAAALRIEAFVSTTAHRFISNMNAVSANVSAIGEIVESVRNTIPQSWIDGTYILVAILYITTFAALSAAYRLLHFRSR